MKNMKALGRWLFCMHFLQPRFTKSTVELQNTARTTGMSLVFRDFFQKCWLKSSVTGTTCEANVADLRITCYADKHKFANFFPKQLASRGFHNFHKNTCPYNSGQHCVRQMPIQKFLKREDAVCAVESWHVEKEALQRSATSCVIHRDDTRLWLQLLRLLSSSIPSLTAEIRRITCDNWVDILYSR